MIYSSIRMRVFPEKRKELSQAITSLVNSIKTQKGCRHCRLCYNLEDENDLCLFGEWESEESLAGHLQSEIFKVLLGATNLLKGPHEIKLYSNVAEPDFHEMAGAMSLFR
jgi:quinol monooxygenase YgiN